MAAWPKLPFYIWAGMSGMSIFNSCSLITHEQSIRVVQHVGVTRFKVSQLNRNSERVCAYVWTWRSEKQRLYKNIPVPSCMWITVKLCTVYPTYPAPAVLCYSISYVPSQDAKQCRTWFQDFKAARHCHICYYALTNINAKESCLAVYLSIYSTGPKYLLHHIILCHLH